MFRIHPAALTALLALSMTSLARAQAASDSSDTSRAIRRDEHAIATDTMRLHSEIALRDSARTTLAQDHAQTQATEARIDSLQSQLARDRKATPRDTAAVSRDEKALKQAKTQLDQNLDRDKREKARLESLEKKVKKDEGAAAEAHHDLRQDRSKVSKAAEHPATGSAPTTSARPVASSRRHK